MSPRDFYSLTRKAPFVPFRIVTSTGKTYDISHPDMVAVSTTAVLVAYPDEGSTLPDRYDIVSMRHVVRLEPQESSVPD